jgi:hypothetical protein
MTAAPLHLCCIAVHHLLPKFPTLETPRTAQASSLVLALEPPKFLDCRTGKDSIIREMVSTQKQDSQRCGKQNRQLAHQGKAVPEYIARSAPMRARTRDQHLPGPWEVDSTAIILVPWGGRLVGKGGRAAGGEPHLAHLAGTKKQNNGKRNKEARVPMGQLLGGSLRVWTLTRTREGKYRAPGW